jgi:hypothetical protein
MSNGFGLTLLEANASGKPARVEFQAKLRMSSIGYGVPPDDPEGSKEQRSLRTQPSAWEHVMSH